MPTCTDVTSQRPQPRDSYARQVIGTKQLSAQTATLHLGPLGLWPRSNDGRFSMYDVCKEPVRYSECRPLVARPQSKPQGAAVGLGCHSLPYLTCELSRLWGRRKESETKEYPLFRAVLNLDHRRCHGESPEESPFNPEAASTRRLRCALQTDGHREGVSCQLRLSRLIRSLNKNDSTLPNNQHPYLSEP